MIRNDFFLNLTPILLPLDASVIKLVLLCLTAIIQAAAIRLRSMAVMYFGSALTGIR